MSMSDADTVSTKCLKYLEIIYITIIYIIILFIFKCVFVESVKNEEYLIFSRINR